MKHLQTRIIRVARDTFELPDVEIDENTRIIDDLGIDSVDANEFHYQLELEFDLALPDSVPAHFNKIKDITKYIDKKIKQAYE